MTYKENLRCEQECIPVGCVPSAHWPYLVVSAMHAPAPRTPHHACPPAYPYPRSRIDELELELPSWVLPKATSDHHVSGGFSEVGHLQQGDPRRPIFSPKIKEIKNKRSHLWHSDWRWPSTKLWWATKTRLGNSNSNSAD